MKANIKAALLSGLVLPGLGQLYKGEKVKGIIIIVLVNIFLLAALYMVLQSLAPLILSMGGEGPVDAAAILERLNDKMGGGRLLLASFCGLWLYSWIDAAMGKTGKE